MSERKSKRSLQQNEKISDGKSTPTVTRSGRIVTPSKKSEYIKQLYVKTPSKKQKDKAHDSSSNMSCSDHDEEENDENMIQKPCAFRFIDQKEVAGRELYGIHTPKKRDAMMLLAENTPKTPNIMDPIGALSLNSPRTPKTPKTPKPHPIDILRKHEKLSTPIETRNKNKRELIRKKIKIAEGTDTESSADEHSDYEPERSTAESSDEESNDSIESDSEEEPQARKDTRKVTPLKLNRSTKTIVAQASTGMATRGRTKAKIQEDFIPDSDNYFIAASNKKSKTSDHTLDQLRSSRLQHDELFSLLNSIHSSEEHEHRISEMFQDLKLNFNRWMLEMSKGYNIIIYGCGSKQQLLHAFCEEHVADKPLVVVNGFFPSLTIKDILNAIKVQLLDITTNSRNDHEVVDLISSALNSMSNVHVFLVINNIDGVMLRKTKDQHILSRLAKINNFHLIASIDHINAPLLWDQTCMDNFNFVWYDCTTLLPYTNETAFENSVFFQNSGELDLAAMSNVFQSLTTNARGIYMILVKSQLDNQKNTNYQGMTFKDLYHKCRESFLVSSDSTLRTQLIEFVDHHMAKIKRSHDGTELVSIPINTKILLLFTQQRND